MYTQKALSKYTLALLAGMVLISSSCKKYLNEGPITSTYGAEFWISQKAVEQSSLAMYGQLRSSLRAAPAYNLGEASYFVNGDLPTGLFTLGAGDAFLKYGITAATGFKFSYIPYGADVLQNWSRFYKLIAQSNLILQNVPAMSTSLFTSSAVKNAYMGEALFMRAYTYFYITRVWGDPVYVSQSYNDVDYGKIPPLPRTPESRVLDSCINDLRTAAAYLSYVPGNTLRANRGSVYALMAHIFEWQHTYDSTHFYAQKVLQEGGYSLEPMSNYKNIWAGKSSAESIFELSMQYNANDPNFAGQGDWAEAKFSPLATFLKGDLVDNRKSTCWIAPRGAFFDQTLFDTATDGRYKSVFRSVAATGGDPAGYMLTKYTSFLYQKPDLKEGPYINNNLVLLRLSDVILLDAEAQAYKGNLTAAAASLKLTEDRAGIQSYKTPVNQHDMINEVVLERGRELIGEGQWYYDLIRTEATQSWLETTGGYLRERVDPTKNLKGYYWPLDMSTLFPQDNLLTQNPWWALHG